MKNTTKFLKQLGRMCSNYEDCGLCPLYKELAGDDPCILKICVDPEKTQNIVSGWAKANPETAPNTILSEFLAKFPDTKLTEYGTPRFCVKILGYNYMDQDMCEVNKGDCSLCWNTPLFEEEKAKPKPVPKTSLKDVIIIGAMSEDEDPDGSYFDHVPTPKSSVPTAPELPQGMNSFIKELCSHLGWDNPTTV